jgi:hypothetical protein
VIAEVDVIHVRSCRNLNHVDLDEDHDEIPVTDFDAVAAVAAIAALALDGVDRVKH